MLTLKESCKYLGISRHTIYRLIKSGALPAKRVGGQWRFEQRDVDKLVTHPAIVPNAPRPWLMSITEVCDFLGLCRQTVYALVKRNQLPAIKSAGKWKFPAQDVRRFLFQGRDVPMFVTGINPGGGVLDMSEAAELLGVNRRTVYRLVKEGKVPGTKVAGVWRFMRTELSRYILDKKSNRGIFTGKSVFFRSSVLDKYRKDTENYYIRENAYDGFVGRKSDYFELKKLQNNEYYNVLKKLHPPLFAEVHYRKIPVKGAYVLALEPKQHQALTPEEAGHWAENILSEAEVAGVQL